MPSRDRVWLHLSLLVLTVVTTTFVGALHYFGFTLGFGGDAVIAPPLRAPSFYLKGLCDTRTVLAILGCHEMGHYLACQYYKVDASLPYFLPAPLPLTGTLGAFIKIRERIPSRSRSSTSGLRGRLPGLSSPCQRFSGAWRCQQSKRCPKTLPGWLGEPLLFRAVAWLVWGDVPDGMSINMHPMGFAAWFGLLATALNLFPIGQLDGGHVACRARATLGVRDDRDDLSRAWSGICFNELAGMVRADARDAVRHGTASPANARRRRPYRCQPACNRRVWSHHADRVLRRPRFPGRS